MQIEHEVPQIRPWIRLFARNIDQVLSSLPWIPIVLFIAPGLLSNRILLTCLVVVGSPLVNAVLFALFGTTPGKWMLGVVVYDSFGEKLTFKEALWRECDVLFRGMGLGIPLISLVTGGIAYGTLTSTGETSWDRDGGFTVTHRPVSILGGALATVLLVGMVIVNLM